jgi:hypothetical protein
MPRERVLPKALAAIADWEAVDVMQQIAAEPDSARRDRLYVCVEAGDFREDWYPGDPRDPLVPARRVVTIPRSGPPLWEVTFRLGRFGPGQRLRIDA